MCLDVLNKLKDKEKAVFQAIGQLIQNRANEPSNHKRISINAYSVSEVSGVSYSTTKKYLNQLQNLI